MRSRIASSSRPMISTDSADSTIGSGAAAVSGAGVRRANGLGRRIPGIRSPGRRNPGRGSADRGGGWGGGVVEGGVWDGGVVEGGVVNGREVVMGVSFPVVPGGLAGVLTARSRRHRPVR